MIKSVFSAIKKALAGIAGVKEIGAWAGDVQRLLEKPQNLPGIYVVYSGATFNTAPASIGIVPVKVDSDMKVQILLVVHSARSSDDAAISAWDIIESVRVRLIGLMLQVGDYSEPLWPASEELVFSEAGLLVYGLNYSMTVRV